ncbi:GTP 3',8-cyclase MoaA [Branchiibius cervicis]|uniref:GTP 3',8-cyclase n=1 Tax=Branchiibius cervicis TaxID=908252 RepID=A0ABW2ASK5_9MICO
MTLVDQFGRVGTDLRVSLTDRCNLRCTYCMPEEGLNWLPRSEHLTDDELVRVVGLFVAEGVTSVRLTGGEPLLRRGLPGVVRRLAGLAPRPELSLTTNGIGLDRLAAPLAEAGLDRVNVSLDAVDPQIYARLTRRNRFHDVERGLKAAADAGLRPVKVNAVATRDGEDPVRLLSWCLDRGYDLRFIEQMPLDAGHTWDRATMLTRDELLTTLGAAFGLTPVEERGSAPAERFTVDGGPATVGIIASVTAPFCGSCDRVRLTADGQVRNCLFARDEDNVRDPLRAGASDAELVDIIRATMWRKARGHGIGRPGFVQPERPMSSIGG